MLRNAKFGVSIVFFPHSEMPDDENNSKVSNVTEIFKEKTTQIQNVKKWS